MQSKNWIRITLTFCVLELATLVYSADESAPRLPKDVPTLEEKVKLLEQRIQELEERNSALEKQLERRHPSSNRSILPPQFGDNFDDLKDRMREMEDDITRWMDQGKHFKRQLIPNFGNLHRFQMQKPRLGVILSAPSNELCERFKNDVKEGAFIMSVMPDSAAEKAGLRVGDCITSFAGKALKSPEDLKDAVKTAPEGKNELLVTRHGEALTLTVELGAAETEQAGLWENEENNNDLEEDDDLPRHKEIWRRGDGFERPLAFSQTEVKASELELTDELAKQMQLSEEQRKKMTEVLAGCVRKLNESLAAKTKQRRDLRGRDEFISRAGALKNLIAKQVSEAEKELADVLSAEQLKGWKDYRQKHSKLWFSHHSRSETEMPTNPNEATTTESFNF